MSEHLHPDPDTLSAFVEGVLPEHERAQCLAHLADCPRCREIVFVAQDTPAPPVVVRPRLLRPMPLLAAAAAVCFAVLGTWLYLRSKTIAPTQEQAAQTTQTAPPTEKSPEVQPPKTVAMKTTPRVPLRRPPEPATPKPATPVATPEVARAAPPPVTVESAQVSVSPLPASPPPLRVAPAQLARADSLSGISGTVTDPTGAAVPQATVELREPAGNTVGNAQTDEAGSFKFTGLVPGRYELRIARAGFSLASQQVELHEQESRRREGHIAGRFHHADGGGDGGACDAPN